MFFASGDTTASPMRPIAHRASGVIKPPSILIVDLPMISASWVCAWALSLIAMPVIAIVAIIAMLLFIILYVFYLFVA